ncbi:OmpA family protein [Paracoccus aminovorans]|uniref:OmpA family protein n=1 Tax=Paracoccus aminovorans TaxID=34004 RepID=UPI002B259005|nr:hypothetical protein [Paracoccus aminovorans]
MARLGDGTDRSYKRGAIMGLTVAEAFILLAFCLLLLFSWWQAETEREALAATEVFDGMTEPQKRALVDSLSDGSFRVLQAMKDAGMPPLGPEAYANARDLSRFMSDAELRRLLKGAAELPPDALLSLSDLVEIGDKAAIVQALNRIRKERAAPEDPAEVIAGRIAAAAEAEGALQQALESALGAQIRRAGGSIGPDGTISLPQSVLFDRDDDRIRNPAFLRQFCPVWLRTMRESGVDISELKIEGHASSEGPSGSGRDAAYLYNLGLSQRRAQNALTMCLNSLADGVAQAWARDHLVAVGYSSNRLILNPEGAEDREKSRRVMFSVAVDREQLLQEIGSDLEKAR